MELPTTLTVLADILGIRKNNSNPYNLLLTSTISLTPELLVNICGSDNWNTFCNWLQQRSVEDRIGTLTPHLRQPRNAEGYRALAKLVKEGYFSTILTTNVDSFLEDALFECGLRSYEKLVVNRDSDEYITTILDREPRGIRIIKLRGSLSDKVLSETFPEAFDLKASLRNSLDNYLNRDIVIVGSIEREDDLRRLLNFHSKKSIYYVLPQSPTSNDDVVKAIRARHNNTDASIISGTYGDFETFFTALESVFFSDKGNTDQSTLGTQPESWEQEEPPHVSPVTLHPGSWPHASEESLPLPAQETPKSEKALEASSSKKSASQGTSTTSTKRGEERGATSLVRMGAIIVFALVGIGGIFLIVSLFANNTYSFNNPLFIILLLVVIAAIILGIIGIINPEQVTQLLSLGANAAVGAPTNSKSEKSKDENVEK